MQHPQQVLAASVVGLSLFAAAAAPARAQVAETVRISLTDAAGGSGPVARRPTPPVFAVFALHATAGIEASDHRFDKVRGELLIRNASVFRVAKPSGMIVGEPFTRTLTYRGGGGPFEVGVDAWGSLDGAPDRDTRAVWVR